MRRLALAAVLAVMGLAGTAAADPWADPNGNLAFDAPRGWTVRPQQMTGGTAVLAFTPRSDCFFFGIPNSASADASVSEARHTTDPLPHSAWVAAVEGIADFAGEGAPSVTSQNVDTSGFWPVQRAQLQWGSRTIHGVIEVRPGYELRGFCSGGDASFDAILNSIGHPNDSTWQAQGGAADQTPVADQTPAPAE